jgi:hypothetical protein
MVKRPSVFNRDRNLPSRLGSALLTVTVRLLVDETDFILISVWNPASDRLKWFEVAEGGYPKCDCQAPFLLVVRLEF